MGSIDWAQGRRLYLQGKSPREVSEAISCNKSSVCSRVSSESWGLAEEVLASVARGVAPARADGQLAAKAPAESAVSVQQRIQLDVSAVLTALEAVAPEDLALHQLAVRERIAGDVAKRAAGVFDIGESSQSVVNIAVLSQFFYQNGCNTPNQTSQPHQLEYWRTSTPPKARQRLVSP